MSKIEKAITNLVDAVMVLTDAGVIDKIPGIADLSTRVSGVRCCGPVAAPAEAQPPKKPQGRPRAASVEDVRELAVGFCMVDYPGLTNKNLGPFIQRTNDLGGATLYHATRNTETLLVWRHGGRLVYNPEHSDDELVQVVQRAARLTGAIPVPFNQLMRRPGLPASFNLLEVSAKEVITHLPQLRDVRFYAQAQQDGALISCYVPRADSVTRRLLVSLDGATYYGTLDPVSLAQGHSETSVFKLDKSVTTINEARARVEVPCVHAAEVVELMHGYLAARADLPALQRQLARQAQQTGDDWDDTLLVAHTAEATRECAVKGIFDLTRDIIYLTARQCNAANSNQHMRYQELLTPLCDLRKDLLIRVGAERSVLRHIDDLRIEFCSAQPAPAISDGALLTRLANLRVELGVADQRQPLPVRGLHHDIRGILHGHSVLNVGDDQYATGWVYCVHNPRVRVYLPTWYKIVPPAQQLVLQGKNLVGYDNA